MAGDVTVKVLREIRDEIRSTRQELKDEIRGLSGRIDQTNDRLGKVEGAVLEMAGQQRFVVRYLRGLTARDRHLEADVDDLRGRVEVLEEKTKT